MDTINTNKFVLNNDLSTKFVIENQSDENEEEFDDDFFDDERSRKPKGKKIKRMRTTYDK